jgi:hypothetical protein
MHSAPGDLQHTGNPTLIGPDGEMIESDRGLFGSSGNGSGKSKSEKVLKFVIKQVEKQMNKQSSGQGQGQQQQEQYNQYMQEYTSGQENPYANAEGTYGDYSQMGGGEGHGFSEFLHGGSGGDGGHSWLESLGLSSGGDSSGDSSALEAIFVG